MINFKQSVLIIFYVAVPIQLLLGSEKMDTNLQNRLIIVRDEVFLEGQEILSSQKARCCILGTL